MQSFDSMPYHFCDAASAYDANLQSHLADANVPTGFTAHVTDVQFWDGGNTPAQFASPCGALDQGFERVTVTVSSSSTGEGGAFSKSLTILKRGTQ